MYEKIYSIKDRYDIYIKSSDTNFASIINSAGDNQRVYILGSVIISTPQEITAKGITINSDPNAFIINNVSRPSSSLVIFSGEGYNVRNLNILNQNDANIAIELKANGTLSDFKIYQNSSFKTLNIAVKVGPNIIANVSGVTKSLAGTILNKIQDITSLSSYNIDGFVYGLNISDSLAQHTVIFHSKNPFTYDGTSLTYDTTGLDIKVINNITQAVFTYSIPVGETLTFNNDGSLIYALINRDGTGTGFVASPQLTVTNGNLFVEQTHIPKLDTSDGWYLPIAMRVDSSSGPLLHWFFGHGVWAVGTSTNVGLCSGSSVSSEPSLQIEFFDSDNINMVYNILLDDSASAVGFDPDVPSSCYFQFNLPEFFDLNKDIFFTFIYDMTTAYLGNVKLNLDYWVYGDNRVLLATNSDTETINASTPIPQTKQIYITEQLKINHTDFAEIGDEIVCKLTRDVTVTNNHTGIFRLIGCTVHQ